MLWIKHDTAANQDAKLQNVLLDYGLEGYGLYWYCLELIAGKIDKNNYTFQLEHDARIIARNTGSTPQRVEEMMRYFVKTELFECSSGVITCLKLAKRLDQSMVSSPHMREIISQLKNHDGIMTASEPSVTKSGSIMQEEKRIDKNRTEKKKNIFSRPSLEDVKSYCLEIKSTIDPEQFIDYYDSNGWKVGKSAMKDWKATVRRWSKSDGARRNETVSKQPTSAAERQFEYAQQAYERAIAEERDDKAIR